MLNVPDNRNQTPEKPKPTVLHPWMFLLWCLAGWEFLQAHWDCLSATDFTTVDVWTPMGLKTIYLLFVIELKSRKVECIGSTANPNEVWLLEAVDRMAAKESLLHCDEEHPKMLLIDRDSKFSEAFHQKLKDNHIKPIKLPPRSPNLNAYMERFNGSFKRECTSRMIFFGKRMVDRATETYIKFYHEERPHQGLDNELIIPMQRPPDPVGEVVVTKRLGGILKSYRRSAA